MLLYYPGNGENHREAIQNALPGMDLLEIGDESLDHTIAELQAMEPGSRMEQPGGHDEFLFFGPMNRDELKQADEALKNAGIRISHKAVQTEHNGNWKLASLMSEIEAEAAYFRKREQLYRMVSHPDMERLKKDEEYMKTLATAYAVLESEDVPPEAVDLAIQAIEEMEKKKAS